MGLLILILLILVNGMALYELYRYHAMEKSTVPYTLLIVALPFLGVAIYYFTKPKHKRRKFLENKL